MRPCPFCARTDGESTAEHWLPDSWEQYFWVPLVMLDTQAVNDEFGPRRVNNRSPFDLKYNGVCKKCNSGWLRDIDEVAKGAVLDFATARTSRIDAESLEAFATHLVRAALIYTWGHRQQNGYPDQLLREMYTSRSVPACTRVFVGSVDEPALVGGRHAALSVEGETFVHVVSWTMGRLFALVVLPAEGFESLTNQVAATVTRRSMRKAQLIWPRPLGINLEFRDRVLTWDEARLLGHRRGLMTGAPEVEPPELPGYYATRLDKLNGDCSALAKPATAVWTGAPNVRSKPPAGAPESAFKRAGAHSG